MANPQKEEGYTQIANEILDALARYGHFGSEEWRVLLFIIRKTYGYHKKWDTISYSQIAKGTGLKRQNAHRAFKKLSSKRITLRLENGLMFNKNYEDWVVSKRMTPLKTDESVIKNDPVVIQSDGKSVIQSDEYKRKKENNKRKKNLKITPLTDTGKKTNQALENIRKMNPWLNK